VLRAPIKWLPLVRSPLYVFEGANQGNTDVINLMIQVSRNPNIRFFEVQGANHFSILVPANRIIANKIVQESRGGPPVGFTVQELNQAFGR
jgi:hypothetical protein